MCGFCYPDMTGATYSTTTEVVVRPTGDQGEVDE